MRPQWPTRNSAFPGAPVRRLADGHHCHGTVRRNDAGAGRDACPILVLCFMPRDPRQQLRVRPPHLVDGRLLGHDAHAPCLFDHVHLQQDGRVQGFWECWRFLLLKNSGVTVKAIAVAPVAIALRCPNADLLGSLGTTKSVSPGDTGSPQLISCPTLRAASLLGRLGRPMASLSLSLAP